MPPLQSLVTAPRLCKLAIAAILLILQLNASVALLLKCPLHQLQLQKIVGFRPPLEYLNADNRIYGPEMVSNFKTRNGQQELPVSQVCWRICNEDPDCIAYVHLLDTDECHGYSYFERTSRYLAISGELPLVADGEAVFYEKTCLRGE